MRTIVRLFPLLAALALATGCDENPEIQGTLISMSGDHHGIVYVVYMDALGTISSAQYGQNSSGALRAANAEKAPMPGDVFKIRKAGEHLYVFTRLHDDPANVAGEIILSSPPRTDIVPSADTDPGPANP